MLLEAERLYPNLTYSLNRLDQILVMSSRHPPFSPSTISEAAELMHLLPIPLFIFNAPSHGSQFHG